MNCVCGGVASSDNLSGLGMCTSCGRYFHGSEETADGTASLWSRDAPDKLRPTGKPHIVAGLVLGAFAFALYFYAQSLPYAVAGEPSGLEGLGDIPTPLIPDEKRVILSSLSLALAGIAPLLWVTGQIIKAISWLPARAPALERTIEQDEFDTENELDQPVR